MHELAICQALIVELENIATQHIGKKIVAVNLKVGPLSGVEPKLLESAFSIASCNTIADGAILTVTQSGIVVRCNQCHKESKASVNRLICADCGHWQTELLSGDEMLLNQVELEEIDNF